MTDFDELYKEYYPYIYRYVHRLSGKHEIAEEITQETFLKILKNIGKFRGDCKLNVWMCQIAKNTFYSYVQKEKMYVDYPLESVETGDDMEAMLVDREQALKLHRILHQLEEPYKEVFSLHVFGELSLKEIAQLFQKTESWARVTFYRAKLKIREAMK